jgi:hypothetical protein
MQRIPPKHNQNICICPECPQNSNSQTILRYRTSFRVTSQPRRHEQHCEWCELWDRFKLDTVRWPVGEKPFAFRKADDDLQERCSTAPSYTVVHRYLRDSRRERVALRRTALERLEDWSCSLEWYDR